jgi:hypothetical protein
MDLEKCLKIVDFELKKLTGRYMELRDCRLRAVNGWLDIVRTLEMAGYCLLAEMVGARGAAFKYRNAEENSVRHFYRKSTASVSHRHSRIRVSPVLLVME